MSHRIHRGVLLGACAAIATACTEGTSPGHTEDFLVDNPGADGGSGLSGGETGDASGGDDGGDDGGRTVSEADIVFVEGDRLYAMSAYSGLAVIDAADPDARLPVLGHYRMPGQPFEMYVDGGQVFAMLTDYGSYAWDDAVDGYSWHSASRLLALDASDPSSITLRGEFEVPGAIQDSRRVGDILYVVTFEDGWCWGCEADRPRTVVTSLDVSDPAHVEVADRIEFDNQTDEAWDWAGPRSVSATDERLYVGGIEYAGPEDAHSMIDVIDITDPGGAMVRGASVEVAGSIASRWQMDEFDGVLRVISQPWGWSSDAPPAVETFTVTSASEVTPLASLPMTLPRPESLQSVRFDGPRAYAITFEQTDPLFTLDLSDPAHPVQTGELEIPGWIYHLEPRGDRIVALGFDASSSQGAINVSLFDVSDLAAPSLISRVGFGGAWADFGEDQNRIHKAFTLLDELGLVLVPFSGWQYDEADDDAWSCGHYTSGVQLVDWTDDALALRGVAPSHGRARRALVHRDRLLAMSDKAVAAFDITDRDAPAARAQVALAANVDDVAIGDGVIVRLATDWWTNEVALEVVSPADPEAAEPLGRLALTDISPEFGCGYSWGRDLFVHDGHAYLLRQSYGYDETDYRELLVLDAIDISDPTAPKWASTLELPFAMSYAGWGLGLQNQERAAVRVGDALVFTASESRYVGEQYLGERARLQVVDLGDAGAPIHAGTLERPDALAHGGLQLSEGELTSWHMRAVDGDASKVRFYFDRFDVSDPSDPRARTPINVPGQPVAHGPAADRLVTVGFELDVVDAPADGCWTLPKLWSYEGDDSQCTIANRPLHLLALHDDDAELLDTLDVEGDDGRMTAAMGDGEHLFVVVGAGNGWGWGWAEDAAVGGGPTRDGERPTSSVAIVRGHDGDQLVEASRVLIEDSPWTSMIGTTGSTAVLRTDRGIGIVDAADPEAPALSVIPTWGWGCYDGTLGDDAVYCPMGEYGLQVIDLP